MEDAETPEIGEVEAEGLSRSPLALRLNPTRLTLSATKIIVNWRLSVRNASDAHIVSLRIWSDMTAAKRTAMRSEEAGRPDMDRAKLHKAELLPPDEETHSSGEWHMPRDEAQPVKRGPVQNFAEPRVLPVARFRLIGAGIPPTYLNFAIGNLNENDGSLPEPLLFDDRIQIFPDLSAVQLA